MDLAIILEYLWMVVVLVVLEGILAADNACVIAVMVKHLPENTRKKALFYGLAGAFVFRFASLFVISYLVDMWQVQAVGAVYLIFISVNHLIKTKLTCKSKHSASSSKSGLWATVLKVEIADIAFAADSILAAVALAINLPDSPLPHIGGLDGGKFIVIFLGGFIGLIIMRYAAQWFSNLLQSRPSLETAAFAIVGWVGIKLAVYTLAHPEIAILNTAFASSVVWKTTFWVVFALICVTGWFSSKPKSA